MRFFPTTLILSLVICVLGLGDGLARRPGETGDRHFRKSARGPGIFTARLEKRKEARKEAREKALAAAEERRDPEENSSAGEVRETAVDPASRSAMRTESAGGREPRSSNRGSQTAREKRRAPGRRGKGSGVVNRRRVVLKPLFGN